MDPMRRTFVVEGAAWRSNSWLLSSEPGSWETPKMAAYERLSQPLLLTANSMGVSGDHTSQKHDGLTALLAFIKDFAFKRFGGGGNVEAEVLGAEYKKKKRSSWLPDPHRRWPVQGW